MPDQEMDDLKAGDAFRDTLMSKADFDHDGAPLWYGWAIMSAFLAGAEYGRQHPETKT